MLVTDIRGIAICGECNASSSDGHRQGCSMKGKRPTDLLEKNIVEKDNVRSLNRENSKL